MHGRIDAMLVERSADYLFHPAILYNQLIVTASAKCMRTSTVISSSWFMVIKAQFSVNMECYFHSILSHKDVSKDIRENYKWIINLTPDPRIYAYI